MFTKIVVSATMGTYFVGFILGVYVVAQDFSQLSSFLTYVGVPVATAIAFYCWKSKAENIIKIRNSLVRTEINRQKKGKEMLPDDVQMSIDNILANINNGQ